jgi:phosphatidylserine synthase
MEINRNVLLPNLVTLGNGVCGFWALTLLFKVEHTGGGPLAFNDPALRPAAWWILMWNGVRTSRRQGGACRAAPARSARSSTRFADLVTFGLVPAVMMMRLSPATGRRGSASC